MRSHVSRSSRSSWNSRCARRNSAEVGKGPSSELRMGYASMSTSHLRERRQDHLVCVVGGESYIEVETNASLSSGGIDRERDIYIDNVKHTDLHRSAGNRDIAAVVWGRMPYHCALCREKPFALQQTRSPRRRRSEARIFRCCTLGCLLPRAE